MKKTFRNISIKSNEQESTPGSFFREPVDAANRQTGPGGKSPGSCPVERPAVGGAGSARYRQEILESGRAGK
jgi:hypothetical protein